MHGTSEDGLLGRLRRNDTLRRLTGGRPDLIIFGVPAAVAAIVVVIVVVFATTGGRGGGNRSAVANSTASSGRAAASTASRTPGVNIGLQTPILISPGDVLTDQDLDARGVGQPGRGEFAGDRLIISKIGVDAPFTYRAVGGDGKMTNPKSWDDVAYYDFSQWPALGGLPGNGGNVVIAGHVDYIHHGPAVFWDLHKLEAGDAVEIRMKDGAVYKYQVVFDKTVSADGADFSKLVRATAEESVTLITCSGDFVNGHYNNRQIVWARRV